MPSYEPASVATEGGREGQTTATDLRPILPRGADNAWQKCEATRTELYDLIEQICRSKGMQALVLQSKPFEHPVWVKFESWVPMEGAVLTARASLLVTITPMPYHRFETIYAIDWEKHGQSGKFVQLHRFGAAEIERMLELLCARPERQLTKFRVKSILKRGQVRIHPLQLWRPRNKVVAIRRDYLKIAMWLLTLTGIVLMAVDPREIGDLIDSHEPMTLQPDPPAAPAYPPAAIPAPEPPPAPAYDPPPQAQPANVVTGTLDAADNRLPDGRYYEEFNYRKLAGERIRISMRSTAFDAFLIVGTMSANGFRMLASNDDERPQNLDAALVLSADLSGEIVIRATSANQGETGAYTLEVSNQ